MYVAKEVQEGKGSDTRSRRSNQNRPDSRFPVARSLAEKQLLWAHVGGEAVWVGGCLGPEIAVQRLLHP